MILLCTLHSTVICFKDSYFYFFDYNIYLCTIGFKNVILVVGLNKPMKWSDKITNKR